MSKEAVPADGSSLIDPLVSLAGSIDGVADLGMTVCFIEEERMAGRHGFVVQRCDAIRDLVDSIVSAMKERTLLHSKEWSTLQSDLVSGMDRLLTAFRSLEHFRSLSPEGVRSSAEAFRTGWETAHRSMREIAVRLAPLDHQSWYAPILERQGTYRTQLEQVCSCFYEEAITSHAGQNLSEFESSERSRREP